MFIFELIDAEGPGFLQVRKQVFEFLLQFERKCVSLVSHFIKKDTKILYIIDERNTLLAVLSVSSSGQILHCINSDSVFPTIKEYFSKEPTEKLFSIIGEAKYTDELSKIFFDLTGEAPKAINDYTLMEYDKIIAEAALLSLKSDAQRRQFLSTCEVFDCDDSDFETIFPIQKSYELEEVVVDKNQYNEKNSRILLRRSLQSGNVFAVRHDHKIVSKASINAKGEKYIQLGGIYTSLAYRNRGIATYLVRTLTQRFKKMNKNIVLFVKKNNATALTVYKNCGFESFADYKILYY